MSTTNRRGLIASAYREDTTEVQLYGVPLNTEIDGVLRICNHSDVATKFMVAHCAPLHGDTAADDDHWLYYNKSLNANSTIEISIHAGPQESVRVAAGLSEAHSGYEGEISITFHLSGNTKVVA